MYLPTSAIFTSCFGLRSCATICSQSERSGSGQSSFKQSQATCARRSFSMASGASYRYSTSRFCSTWLFGTLQNKAILSLICWSSGCSLLQTIISGWIPMPCSSLTLACVGFVFISWEAESHGISVTWIKMAFSCPTSCWNWRMDSKNGWLSISPTVPPTSIMAIRVSSSVKLR